MKRTFLNIGFNSGGIYKSRENNKHTKVYRAWANMLTRCYSDVYLAKNPTYKGCTVHEDWHDFQVFAQWYSDNYKNNYHLDKDLLIIGNKIYGPDTCCFIPQEINKIFADSARKRGKYKIGVYFNKDRNKFCAKLQLNGKSTYIGLYLTEDEAYDAYKLAKLNYIKEMAENYKNVLPSEVYKNMLNWGH